MEKLTIDDFENQTTFAVVLRKAGLVVSMATKIINSKPETIFHIQGVSHEYPTIHSVINAINDCNIKREAILNG